MRRDTSDLRNDLFDLGLANRFLLLGLRQDALRSARFVDYVDRLVGQMTIVDELGRELRGGSDRARRVLDAVMLFKARLQPFQDLDRLGNRRLDHVDLLEPARQRVILLEDPAILVVGRCADALQLPAGERRLEQIRRIERATRRRAGADQRVNLVNEQNRVRVRFQLLQHCFQPLLEITAVLCAGQQCAHVERIHARLLEDLRHVAFEDAPRQALGNCGLADAGLAN